MLGAIFKWQSVAKVHVGGKCMVFNGLMIKAMSVIRKRYDLIGSNSPSIATRDNQQSIISSPSTPSTFSLYYPCSSSNEIAQFLN